MSGGKNGHQETAVKCSFDIMTREWRKTQVWVTINPQPFQRGTLRVVHRGSQSDKNGETHDVVFKFFCADILTKLKLGTMNRKMYEDDVSVQTTAQYFAKQFNSKDPPKRVAILDCWLLELVERPGIPLCFVEPQLNGTYTKYNDNWGGVFNDRNTPQAFSHFTLEDSRRTLLVCDIQGVSDIYTDPRIHSRSGTEYGIGDKGMEGMRRFVQSHICNPICQKLRLPVAGLGQRPAETILPASKDGSTPQITVGGESPHSSPKPLWRSNFDRRSGGGATPSYSSFGDGSSNTSSPVGRGDSNNWSQVQAVPRFASDSSSISSMYNRPSSLSSLQSLAVSNLAQQQPQYKSQGSSLLSRTGELGTSSSVPPSSSLSDFDFSRYAESRSSLNDSKNFAPRSLPSELFLDRLSNALSEFEGALQDARAAIHTNRPSSGTIGSSSYASSSDPSSWRNSASPSIYATSANIPASSLISGAVAFSSALPPPSPSRSSRPVPISASTGARYQPQSYSLNGETPPLTPSSVHTPGSIFSMEGTTPTATSRSASPRAQQKIWDSFAQAFQPVRQDSSNG